MANCCCIDVDEPPKVHHARLIRGRKDHECVECGEKIPAGHLHERVNALYDGFPSHKWSTFRTCARCANVRDEYFSCGWEYGSVAEHFEECFGFDYREGIPADFAPCKGKQP